MPNQGDSYTVQLRETHLNWGNLRYTGTRDIIFNEVYIPIPSAIAERFSIYNTNYINGADQLGVNIFNCTSNDCNFNCVLKSSGCSSAGDVYAKNLHVCGDLKGLAPWANALQIHVGDSVRVEWTSPNDVTLTHIPR